MRGDGRHPGARPGRRGLLIACLIGLAQGMPAGLLAQAYSIPGATQPGTSSAEKRPTSRNPRYIPPFLPEYLRRKLDPAAGLLLSSSEGLDFEALIRLRALQRSRRKNRFSRYEGRDYSETADADRDRHLFEADMLRQFGVTLPGLPSGASEPYHETAGRRFQIVFLLSLPITSVFSYGIVTAAKGTFGRKAGLTQSETIAVALGGLLSSGFIAFRDLRLWREEERRRFQERERPGGAFLWRDLTRPSEYALPPIRGRDEIILPLHFTRLVQF